MGLCIVLSNCKNSLTTHTSDVYLKTASFGYISLHFTLVAVWLIVAEETHTPSRVNLSKRVVVMQF
jgi:hypothetical protein